jgi:hypothetical protein
MSEQKQYGKGKGPEKGRNLQKFRDGWDYWKKAEKKKNAVKKCKCHLHKNQVCDICQGTFEKQ